MKNFILGVILSGIGLVAFSQTLPNYEFQTWVNFDAYENPEHWSASNDPVLATLSVIPVTKSDDAYSGDYSARLETLNIPFTTFKIPGLITLAQIEIDYIAATYNISGGMALQENVSKLSGMYKYTGTEGDSASVVIYNFKHDAGSEPDTIGIGVAFLPDASSWTPFTVSMNNFNNHVPDTFNVVIISSSALDVTPGSVLLVDDLTIETNTGIINLSDKLSSVKVYPNPSAEFVTFEASGYESNRLISIYNVTGRLVDSRYFTEKSLKVSVGEFPSGLYSFRVSKNNRLLGRGSFVKE